MTKTRKTPDFEMVKPNWILKLKEAGMTSAEIGEAIGKTNQYTNHCINKGQVAKTSEIAAEFVWHKKFGLKKSVEKTKVCLVTIDAEHVPTIEKMVTAFGGALSVCTLNK